MYIIPAIDIIEGKCVRLTQGDYAQKKIYNENPLEIAKQFEDAGLQRLHLVDLDGAKAELLQRKIQIESIQGMTVKVSDVYLRNGKVDSAFSLSFQIQDLPNSDDLQTFVGQCEKTWQGQLVTLHMVAGDFQACKRINSQGDKAWMGIAPVLGILKQEGDDGVYELEEFHFAD